MSYGAHTGRSEAPVPLRPLDPSDRLSVLGGLPQVFWDASSDLLVVTDDRGTVAGDQPGLAPGTGLDRDAARTISPCATSSTRATFPHPGDPRPRCVRCQVRSARAEAAHDRRGLSGDLVERRQRRTVLVRHGSRRHRDPPGRARGAGRGGVLARDDRLDPGHGRHPGRARLHRRREPGLARLRAPQRSRRRLGPRAELPGDLRPGRGRAGRRPGCPRRSGTCWPGAGTRSSSTTPWETSGSPSPRRCSSGRGRHGWSSRTPT